MMINCANIFEVVRGRTRIRDVFRRNKEKTSVEATMTNDVNGAFQIDGSKIVVAHETIRLDVAGPSHNLHQLQNLECCLCYHQKTVEDVASLILCDHYACRECLESYLIIEITESRIDIVCPLCPVSIHPTGKFLLFFSFKYILQKFFVRFTSFLEPSSQNFNRIYRQISIN